MTDKKKILFSAFDIGGGNAVFPVAERVSRDKKFSALLLIGGPSKEIFKKKKIKFINADLLSFRDLKDLIYDFNPDFFIGGTSAGLTFDKKILDTLKKNGAKTIYILDYWANYWQRFSSEKKDFRYLPDMICVMDQKAKKEMVAEGFDPKIIKITGNPHFDHFRKIKKGDSTLILFISTPVSVKEKSGYDEFTVIEGILRVLKSGNFPSDFKVIIRPHPSEKSEKFDRYVDSGIRVDDETSIEELLSRAGLVIGMTSVVLFQAAIAGKRVISYQPNLKSKDFSVVGEFGLGQLATGESELRDLFKKYSSGIFPESRKSFDMTVPHATGNIIDMIKKYKYEK